MIQPRTADPGDLDSILALNAADEVATSALNSERLASLVKEAFRTTVVDQPAEAFLLAFDQNAAYDSPNFIWFRDRYSRFVYVDRIVTSVAKRGRGYGRALYEDLFAWASHAGHDLIACEVNINPPNPASDAFHAFFDFQEVGRADLGGGKAVRYLTKAL